MAKVSRRGGFSDRNGIKPENMEIQLTNFDKRTRMQLRNMISQFYSQVYVCATTPEYNDKQEFLRFVMGSVYCEPVDYHFSYMELEILNTIYDTILNDEYDDVLTVIEAVIAFWDTYLKKKQDRLYYSRIEKRYVVPSLFDIANEIFEREYIGYRFIGGQITQISDSCEVETIEETLVTEHKAVRECIAKAIQKLSDRDHPDYENSVKESINAVETMCVIITKKKGREATLGKMLKKLEEGGIVIHPGLKTSFDSLYGYATNAKDVRHAGNIEGSPTTFEEAKFILVTCCAFINYLSALQAKLANLIQQ